MDICKLANLLAAALLTALAFEPSTYVNAANGDTGGLCEDLSRFACAPGEYDDGTGLSATPTEFSNSTNELKEKIKKDFRARFRAVLQNPNNSYFKKIALSALGLTYAPFCQSPVATEQEKCLENLTSGVAELSFKQVFSSFANIGAIFGAMFGVPGNLKDIDLLTQNELFVKTTQELSEKAKVSVSNPAIVSKIQQKIFPEIKNLLIEKIKADVPDEKTSNLLIEKVRAIQWDGTSCFAFPGDVSVAPLLVPNAIYNPGSNSFKICNGLLLNNKSEFQIVFAMAHELSHSIDPCVIAMGPKDFSFHYSKNATQSQAEVEYPIKGLIACLRGEKSVHAERNTQQQSVIVGAPPAGVPSTQDESGGYLGGGYLGTPKAKPQPFTFCKGDQIGESFADWMASEILPEYMAKSHPQLTKEQFKIGYANAFRGICSPRGMERGNEKFDPHPSNENRINRILLVNPNVRAQMGCSPKHDEFQYCSVQKGNQTLDIPVLNDPSGEVQ